MPFIPTTKVGGFSAQFGKIFVAQNVSLFHFGVLESSVHMAWTKAVCGRLTSRISYSNLLVYNNFVWCKPTDEQGKKIEQTAEKIILQVRKKHLSNAPESPTTLADLYDPIIIPKDLRDAHKANDAAVLEAYGFDKNFSETQIVAELMKWYNEKTKEG